MATFLKTTGVVDRVQQIIDNSRDKLILISPYLKIDHRTRQSLADKDLQKFSINLVYGKTELQSSELNWLQPLRSIRVTYCANLHAKCYLNEKEAVVTSMNLHEFSEVNNIEMGIYVDKTSDPELYNSIFDEAMRIVRTSRDIETTASQVPKTDDTRRIPPSVSQVREAADKSTGPSAFSQVLKAVDKLLSPSSTAAGVCIHCGAQIKLDPKHPYCVKCFNSWKHTSDNEHKEKHCHVCGKSNKSTLKRPACLPCYREKKDVLEFPS